MDSISHIENYICEQFVNAFMNRKQLQSRIWTRGKYVKLDYGSIFSPRKWLSLSITLIILDIRRG